MDYRSQVFCTLAFVVYTFGLIVVGIIEIPIAILEIAGGVIINRSPKKILWFFTRKIYDQTVLIQNKI